MYNTMRRALIWAVATAAVIIIALYVAVPSVLSYYDYHTKQRLLHIVAQELPPGASAAQMNDFMRKHTARFSLDENYRHEYDGILKQTRIDKLLFDRKVQIVLKLSRAGTLDGADVRIYYTAL